MGFQTFLSWIRDVFYTQHNCKAGWDAKHISNHDVGRHFEKECDVIRCGWLTCQQSSPAYTRRAHAHTHTHTKEITNKQTPNALKHETDTATMLSRPPAHTQLRKHLYAAMRGCMSPLRAKSLGNHDQACTRQESSLHALLATQYI